MTGRNRFSWTFWWGLAACPCVADAASAAVPASPAGCPAQRPAQRGASEEARLRGAYKEALAAAETAVAQAAARRGSDPAAHANAVVQQALSLSELNRFAEALPKVESAAATLRRLRGPVHFDSITARIALAAINGDAGRTLKAEAQLRALIAEMAALPCPDRDRHGDGRLALAGILPEEKNAEARQLAEAGLADRRSLYGERHWKTAQAEILTARLMRTPAGYAKAAEILEGALDKLATLEPDDVRLLSAREAWAANLSSRQRQAQGAEIANEAWTRARTAYGDSAPITLALAQSFAVALIGSGRADEADPILAGAFRTAAGALGESHPRTMSLLLTAALMRNAQKQYEQAEQNVRRYNDWAYRTYGLNHSATVYGSYILAIILYARDKKSESAKIYLTTYRMAAATFPKNDPIFADLLPAFAYNLADINLPAESLRYYDMALEAQKSTYGEGDPRTLLSSCRLGHLAVTQGQRDRAIEVLTSAADLARRLPPADATRRECLLKYAEILFTAQRLDEVRQILTDEYFPAGVNPDKLGAADLRPVYLMAMVAGVKEEFEEFDRLMKLALPLASTAAAGDDALGAFKATTTYIQFLAQFQRNDEIYRIIEGPFLDLWNKAKTAHYLSAFEMFMTIAPYLVVLSSDDPGSLTSLNGLFRAGLTDLKDILPQHPALHDQLIEASMMAASYLDDPPETVRLASQLYERRLAAFGPDDNRTVAARWRLGGALLLTGKPAEAEQALRAVEPTLTSLTTGMGRLAAIEFRRNLLTALLRLPGREAEALGLARRVVADVKAWRAANSQDRSRFARFLGMAATEEVVFPSLADADWAMTQVTPADAADLRIEAWDALQRSLAGPASRAIAIAAARAAAERHGSGLGNLARERHELLDRWRSSEAKIAESLLAGPGGSDPAELEAGQRATEARLDWVDAELRRRFPDYYALIQPEPMALVDVRAMLAPDEAALLAVSSSEGTHVMVVTRDDLQWRLVDLQYTDLTARVAKLRADLEADPQACREAAAAAPIGEAAARRCGAFDRTTAWSLYSQVLAPFEDLLRGKRHVFVAASGPLASIPFGIFVTEPPQGDDSDPAALRATPWFAERHALVEIPSIQSLRLLRGSSRPNGGRLGRSRRFAGYGDPMLFGSPSNRREAPAAPALKPAARSGEGAAIADVLTVRDLPRLPGTAAELLDLARALGAPYSYVHLREEATEAEVRTADLSKTKVIAFATHGLIPWQIDGVAEPALVFTPPQVPSESDDGLLTTSEIVGMRLQAEWVILSACNTAAGEFQGAPVLSGLARAFLFAGARSLLVSHWPVRDDVAAELTADAILRQKRGRGMSRAEALQAAMRAIRNSPIDDSRAHPAAWAPFVLVGDVR